MQPTRKCCQCYRPVDPPVPDYGQTVLCLACWHENELQQAKSFADYMSYQEEDTPFDGDF